MTITFDDHVTDRRREDWESALLAAIVIAGVKEDPAEAMQAAQWAIARLSSQ